MKKLILLTGLVIGFSSVATHAQSLAVDFGGNYTSSNINSSASATFATGDYNFNGSSTDRVASIAFGTTFTSPNSPNWTTPLGKSGGVISYGISVANIGSLADPSISTNRISSSNIIQAGNGAGTSSLRIASAWYWDKASFVNGQQAVGNLGLSDTTGSLSATFSNSGTPATGFQRTSHILLQNAGLWYLSDDLFGGSSGTLTFNGATGSWYAFDPTANALFWDENNRGSSVLGSTFTDINSLGVYVQHELINGTSANAALEAFSSFQARVVAVPEPSTYALLGLGALVLVLARRRRAAGA